MITELREVLEGAGPSLTLVSGLPTRRLTRSLTDALASARHPRTVYFTAPGLPDPDLRELFRARLDEAGANRGPAGTAKELGPDAPGRRHAAHRSVREPSPWGAALAPIAGWAERDREAVVVVFDGAHHLLAAGADFGRGLEELWSAVRARALPVHVVLAGVTPDLEAGLERVPEALREAATRIEAPAHRPDEVGARWSAWPPADRVRGWTVFGGEPSRVALVDPRSSLETEIRRLILEPDAPLHHDGDEVLRGRVQNPARYASLLRALALGARDWRGLRERCPDFSSGAQMAPYVARLQELGLVAVRRSLDAGPRTRNRRYELADPFLGFWYRFVLPRRGELATGHAREVLAERIRPALEDHVARHFPRACREWTRGAAERVLPAPARETGGLWGAGYDLDPAGTLANGAPFYGTCRWAGGPVGEDPLDEVDRQLRETRYGFGREARVRLIFSREGFTPEGRRRLAREPLAWGVGLEELVGA